MKKLLFAVCLLLSVSAYAKPKISFFHSPHCHSCKNVKAEVLPRLQTQYGALVEWEEIDILDNAEGVARLYSLGKADGRQQVGVPSVFAGGRLLVGRREIEENLGCIIEELLAEETQPACDEPQSADIKNAFVSFSALTVVGSGLADGINPCAFAVIVFFISFLAVYGYTKKEMLVVGLAYCFAVFATYFLVGLGLFKFFYAFSGVYWFMKIFYYFVAALCFAFFGFTVYDYFQFRKTGSAEGLLLQLPKPLKKRINAIIGGNLRNHDAKSLPRLALSSLGVGFLVSLIEGVCTGQMYVPTIVFILKEPALRVKAFFYLFIYNLMFIAPLLVVLTLALAGTGSQKFNLFLKQHLGIAKIALAVMFLALGIFMLRGA